MAIQFTHQGTAPRVGPRAGVLAKAATAALSAPSIFNSQPWSWRIGEDTAELRADRRRQLRTVDPDGRLLTLSCGAALHHATTALAAAGFTAEVVRLPDARDPDLLATVRLGRTGVPEPAAVRQFRAMALRRTDRRPFGETPVPRAALDRLRAAAEAHGAHLHVATPDTLSTLTVAAGHAAARELADPAYRAELAAWVRAGAALRDAGDGVPTATAAPPAARPVPIRDFIASGPDRTTIHDRPPLADRFARYLLIFTDGDVPADWLAAGEALSAVLLTATAYGLGTSPLSDVVEVPQSRLLLRGLLAGIGQPQIAVRVGVPATGAPPPPAPRRRPDSAIALASPDRDGS